MSTEMRVEVGALEGKMRLTGKGHTEERVCLDYLPPLGEDQGFTGLELLLVSLAGCSGHTTLFLLRRMGKKVDDLQVEAVGQRREEHPTVFSRIDLTYRLRGDGLDAAAVEKAIGLSESTYCPVWAHLKDSVPISWKVEIA